MSNALFYLITSINQSSCSFWQNNARSNTLLCASRLNFFLFVKIKVEERNDQYGIMRGCYIRTRRIIQDLRRNSGSNYSNYYIYTPTEHYRKLDFWAIPVLGV